MPNIKMICPYCKVEMNHHADKTDYSIRDPAIIDPEIGGVVEEIHTCPACGQAQTRPANS